MTQDTSHITVSIHHVISRNYGVRVAILLDIVRQLQFRTYSNPKKQSWGRNFHKTRFAKTTCEEIAGILGDKTLPPDRVGSLLRSMQERGLIRLKKFKNKEYFYVALDYEMVWVFRDFWDMPYSHPHIKKIPKRPEMRQR